MRIELSDEAAADLAEAEAFIASDSPRAATAFRERVRSLLERLATREFEGPTTLITGIAVQSWALPPYRIYYLRLSEGLFVVRIYHQALGRALSSVKREFGQFNDVEAAKL